MNEQMRYTVSGELLYIAILVSQSLVIFRVRSIFSTIVHTGMYMYVYFSFFFWPLYCFSFLELQFLITPWVSSNFS
jgi:hypothetical protein